MGKRKQRPMKCPYCGHTAVLKPKASLREDFDGDEWVFNSRSISCSINDSS